MGIRALVVDDSPTMQRFISAVLSADKEIEIVGCAANANEARASIKALDPDVITLDIEMPGMSGLDFLKKIMALRPMPVVVVSSHAKAGATAAVEALSTGAFCCLPKPKLDDEAALTEMREMTKQAARCSELIKSRARRSPAAPQATPQTQSEANMPDLIVVGSSTGGVDALTELFSGFPANCPPTVVTQHMPAEFTKSLAASLDKKCEPNVVEAVNDTVLKSGTIYIAPGAIGHCTINGFADLVVKVRPGEPISGHMPSVDALFRSVASIENRKIAAALLTGMGSDGAAGLLELKQNGAHTIAQDEATSLVYGMPRAAVELGAADKVLPISRISNAIFGG